MKKILLILMIVLLALSPVFSGGAAEETSVTEENTFTFTDDLGREFSFSHPIEKIAPSGNLAQMILFSIAQDEMVGISSQLSENALRYMNPKINELPLVGTFYGRKANLNREAVILADPDVVIDMGEIKGDEANITDDLDTLSEQIGIPVVFIECYLDNTADAYRRLGVLLNREEEAEKRAVYAERAINTAATLRAQIDNPVRIYYSSSPDALSAIATGSFHGEVIEKIGCENVVPASFSDGGNLISLEQIILWDPDVILLSDRGAYDIVTSDSAWQGIRAVKENRVYLIPSSPYSFIDSPPSVNRIIGIYWLGCLIYPELYKDIDLEKEMKEFYSLFYGYELTDEEVENLLNVQPLKSPL